MAQPKIKIEYEPTDWIIEIIGAIGILFLVGIPIYFYNSLPDVIPLQYNAQGEADGYGNKSFIWTLPIIGVISYFGLHLLNKFPHIFNYPKKITPENVQFQYKIATRFIRFLNTSITCLFCYLAYTTIQPALGLQSRQGKYFIVVFLILIFAPIAIYFFKSVRTK